MCDPGGEATTGERDCLNATQEEVVVGEGHIGMGGGGGDDSDGEEQEEELDEEEKRRS